MDLTTRCPQCADQFPVSLQQLQLRKGYIRCANCAHIFDAYEAVVPSATAEHTVSPSSQAAVPIRTRETETEPPAFTVRDPGHQAAEASHTIRDPDHRMEETGAYAGSSHHLGAASPYTEDEPGFHADESWRGSGSGLYVEPRAGREAGPEFIDEEKRSGIGFGGLLLSLLILVGLAAALLQAAYIYRVQLANEFPGLRPALERYCEALDCTVDYPRRLAQIAIMDSSLQAIRDEGNDNGKDSRMTLNVVLRNNYERPQQWPTISVELVDFSGTVAARRLLAPSDYLPELSLQRPFPARSEVRVSVPITVQGVQINGYQLDTFFP